MNPLDELFKDGRPVGIAPFADEAFEKQCPTLFGFLNQRTYGDGTAVTQPTIVIRRVPGALEIVLQVHDFDVQKVAVSRTVGGLFKALEKALGDAETPWKPYTSRLPSPLKEKLKKKKG